MRSSKRSVKNRCSHKGTKVMITTSILLLFTMLGCGHDRIDTNANAPNITKGITECTSDSISVITTTASTSKTNKFSITSTTANITAQTTATTPITTTALKTISVSLQESEINYTKPVTTNAIQDNISITNTTAAVISQAEECVVYKPSTYYVHRNTCRWNSADAYKITDTNDIEARKCSECNPDINIVCEYTLSTDNNGLPITETERILLCNLVGREYGSDWVSVPEKAKVVAVVMNRVKDPRFPNTIYDVLTQPYQFSGYVPCYNYTYQVTDSVIEAVDYYFAHPEEFGDWLSFEGDGTWNYFSKIR